MASPTTAIRRKTGASTTAIALEDWTASIPCRMATGNVSRTRSPCSASAEPTLRAPRLVATGPRRRCRVLRLGGTGEDAEAAIIGKRCADVAGFNVCCRCDSVKAKWRSK